jgi:hypothetical protein
MYLGVKPSHTSSGSSKPSYPSELLVSLEQTPDMTAMSVPTLLNQPRPLSLATRSCLPP